MNRLLLHQLRCLALFLAFARVTVAQSASADNARCYHGMAVGNCGEQIQRWYFNYKTGLCQTFTYTGCGGNDNNFDSYEYCQHACDGSRPQSADNARCYHGMAVGNCGEQIQRWYFNYKTGLCQPFTYTGCGGNGNNFNSTEYCHHACHGQSAKYARCYHGMAEGNCSEQIQRWYFNYKTGLCQPFTYTGCGGNDNNFNSTEYCHHACHASGHPDHGYSIEDSAAILKGKKVADDGATTPTDFSNQRPLHSTRQPTLIRNEPDSDTRKQQVDRQPVDHANHEENRPKRRKREVREGRRRRKASVDADVGYDAAPEEKFAGESAQWKNLKARRYDARRLAPDQYAVDDADVYADEHSYYNDDGWNDDVGNSFRRRRGRGRGGVGVMSELLARMQQTVDLLERFVVAANRRGTPHRRRPTPKNADEERPAVATSTAEKAARAVSDYFRQRATNEARAGSGRRPGKHARRRGGRDQRLLQVALLGRLERLPAGTGDRRAHKPEIGAAEKSQVDDPRKKTDVTNDGIGGQRGELERQQDVDPSKAAASNEDHEDPDNDDDVEVMSDRIRAIIADPTSSFTYENISPEDMVSLEEMMSQSSDYGTMKLVEKDEDEVEEAAKKSDGSTAAQQATTMAVAGDSSGANNDSGDAMAKPEPQAANGDSTKAL